MVSPDMTTRDADALDRRVAGPPGRWAADENSRQIPEAGSFTWTTRAALARRISGYRSQPGKHAPAAFDTAGAVHMLTPVR